MTQDKRLTRLRTLVLASALGMALPAPAVAQTLGRQVTPRAAAPSVAQTTSVRSQYVVHCAGCHGIDGAGAPEGQVPDMRQLGQLLRLEGGRAFVVSVPGVMGSGLSDQQVAEVTNWILTTLAKGSAPPDFRPYDAAEVRLARATPLVDVAAARARLMRQAQTQEMAPP